MTESPWKTIRWANGEVALNPADCSEQNQLRMMFERELKTMDKDDVQLLASLLIKKGSSFISAMLHRYTELTTKQKAAALNSFAKRRRSRVAEFSEAPIALEFDVLSKVAPKRRLTIITMFISHKQATNNLTEEQFNTLLFPLSTTHTEQVNSLKELVFRKKMRKKYNENTLREMLANDEVIKFRAFMAKVDDPTLKKMIIAGDWPANLKWESEDSMLSECLKRGLIKKG